LVNWKAVGIGFIVTLVIALIGLFVPYLSFPLSPIIGGIVVGYIVGGTYKEGIINGGLAAGITGFIFTLVAVTLLGGTISAITASAGVSLSSGTLALIAVLGAVFAFILYFILGLIGGVIGVAIKERGGEKHVTESAPTKKPLNIPFTKENIPKCLCSTCPVQGDSECVKEKMMKIQEIMQSEEEMMPQPRDLPGMYCANGKAICIDIDTTKNCICSDCTIYKEYNLENADPTFHYCKDGKAMQKS